jgi:CubicO group peptidase (beta-lactamase class C family)
MSTGLQKGTALIRITGSCMIGAVAVCAAIGATAIASARALTSVPSPSGPVIDEGLYRERFDALMRSGGVMTRYTPMEKIPGASPATHLTQSTESEPTIMRQALDQASDYAKASNARAFIVWRKNKVERADYYRGANADTQIVSKSLSKPLTAIAIGRAIALGKIQSVDQLLTDFIPEWRGTPKATMSIRHLLDMRSGLLEQMGSADPDHPINRAYIDPDHGWRIIHEYPLTHAPGSYYGYGNAVAELVAVVIERATGRRYADFLDREILRPIGAAGGEIWIDRPAGLAHSGCCMTLPAESWLKLGILLADNGVAHGKRLLPRGFVDQMARGTAQNPHYGMGVWVAGPYVARRGFGAVGKPGPKIKHGEPYLDRDLFLFDGNANQVVYISRAARLVVLRAGDTPPVTPEWDNSVLPNIVMRGIKWGPGEVRPIPQVAP